MGGGFERKAGDEGLAHSVGRDASMHGSAGKQTLTQQLALYQGPMTPGLIQRKPIDVGRAPSSSQVEGADTGAVQRMAAHGVSDGGDSLPHGSTIQRLFGRHDIGDIKAHVGGAADTASRAIGAEAYATGNHVAFASMPSVHTAAHEAAHVVQQRGGVQLKGGVGAAGDSYEQHADAVADRVVAGSSAEELLDAYAPSSSAAPAGFVQRKPASDSAAASDHGANSPVSPVNGGRAAHLIHLLTTMSPGAGGDPVVAYLNTLDTPALLETLSDAVGFGYTPQLHARLASASPILTAALYAAELTQLSPVAPSNPLLQRAGAALDHISRDQQLQILSYLLHRHGVSVEATTLVEGVLAMREGGDRDTADASQEQLPSGAGRGAADPAGAPAGDEHAVGAAVGASIAGGAAPPAPINPAPWAPPGNQPGGLYVGNAAHNAIATVYRDSHPGELIFNNNTPISTILDTLTQLGRSQPNAAALAQEARACRPDIANLVRHHLYEIKPATAQAEAAAKARMYLGIFQKAGVAMSLGPMGEPGTSGGLPAPAGVFMFQSPEPGVITYEYRKGRLVPVPVAQPEPARERRWRWELQPLTPAQRQAIVTTTIGGAVLIMLMLILSAVTA